MSWADEIAELSEACDDEFGTCAIITPTLARPNMRAGSDPSRPTYIVFGVFHETARNVGDTTRESDGMREVNASSTVTTLSVNRVSYPEAPMRGDLVELPEHCRKFRIRDIQYEMPGRSLLILEGLQHPRMR